MAGRPIQFLQPQPGHCQRPQASSKLPFAATSLPSHSRGQWRYRPFLLSPRGYLRCSEGPFGEPVQECRLLSPATELLGLGPRNLHQGDARGRGFCCGQPLAPTGHRPPRSGCWGQGQTSRVACYRPWCPHSAGLWWTRQTGSKFTDQSQGRPSSLFSLLWWEALAVRGQQAAGATPAGEWPGQHTQQSSQRRGGGRAC